MDFLSVPANAVLIKAVSAELARIVDKWKNDRQFVDFSPYLEIVKETMKSYGFEYVGSASGWDAPVDMSALLFSNEGPDNYNNHPVMVMIHSDFERDPQTDRTVTWLRTIQVVRVE